MACGGPETPEAGLEAPDAPPQIEQFEQALCASYDPAGFVEYCYGQSSAPYAGQCLGMNQLIVGVCIMLDQSRADSGCAAFCNSI